ncbi:MAG: response regulator transcription factor [Williamsia sp.]|nr:response regulator transcription factor [Williamsia sp.]
MKIPCLIIDDEPFAQKGMEEYVRETDFLELVATCDSAVKAYSILHKEAVQLILLDIDMPKLSGIEFLRSLKNPPAAIFITAYSQYALESYELDIIDYLVKPVSFQRFCKAVGKARDFLSKKEGDPWVVKEENYFFLKVNSKFEKIAYEEVLFVEALQNYVSVHLRHKKLISYLTLSSLEKQLPPEHFMRVHKSYLVALNKIDTLEGNVIAIGGQQIPVSRSTKEQLMHRVVASKLVKRQ